MISLNIYKTKSQAHGLIHIKNAALNFIKQHIIKMHHSKN